VSGWHPDDAVGADVVALDMPAAAQRRRVTPPLAAKFRREEIAVVSFG